MKHAPAILALLAIASGLVSLITFNPFTGNGLVEVLGGFALVLCGVALVINDKTFKEL